MSDESFDEFFLSLPSDPDEAFIVFQKQKFAELQQVWEADYNGWQHERTYVNAIFAFDEVYQLGVLKDYGVPPSEDERFSQYFQVFRAEIEKIVLKFQLERVRRAKGNKGAIVKLDDAARTAIRALITALREKLDALELTESKRRELVSKLNVFASEVEQNLSRTEAFNSFVVGLTRTASAAAKEFKPLMDTVNRVLDQIDRAQDWVESLPPWTERKKIEGPQKKIEGPRKDDFKSQDLDDEIPF